MKFLRIENLSYSLVVKSVDMFARRWKIGGIAVDSVKLVIQQDQNEMYNQLEKTTTIINWMLYKHYSRSTQHQTLPSVLMLETILVLQGYRLSVLL